MPTEWRVAPVDPYGSEFALFADDGRRITEWVAPHQSPRGAGVTWEYRGEDTVRAEQYVQRTGADDIRLHRLPYPLFVHARETVQLQFPVITTTERNHP